MSAKKRTHHPWSWPNKVRAGHKIALTRVKVLGGTSLATLRTQNADVFSVMREY
jgi:hypothetical protein